MSKQARKILLVPSAYYPSLGGVEEISRNLAVNLGNDGYEVAVATNKHPLTLPEKERLFGADVHRFHFYYPNRTIGGLLDSWKGAATLAEFAMFMNSWRPDIVHVICPSTSALYLWAIHQLQDFRTLVTFQGELFMDANKIYDKSALLRKGLAQLLSTADGVTACSDYVLQDAKKKYKIDQPIQEIVFNGVDLKEANKRTPGKVHKKPFVFALGRLVENKGFDILIKAFAQIAEKQPGFDLLIAGEGTESDTLQKLIDSHNMSSRIILIGRKDREDVSALFAECSLFVLPSLYEPFGIVCLEAMRAGKPVIATNAGGPPEFIDKSFGNLVAPSNASELATAIDAVLSDNQARTKLGATAKDAVKKFDWQKITQQYENIYDRLLASP